MQCVDNLLSNATRRTMRKVCSLNEIELEVIGCKPIRLPEPSWNQAGKERAIVPGDPVEHQQEINLSVREPFTGPGSDDIGSSIWFAPGRTGVQMLYYSADHRTVASVDVAQLEQPAANADLFAGQRGPQAVELASQPCVGCRDDLEHRLYERT